MTAVVDGEVPGIVRPLERADLPACLSIALDRGWRAEKAKWRFLLEVGDGFGIDDPSGRLAGVVIITCYEPALAVIGMLLVASRHGRRGIGRRLMQHALDQASGRVVYLCATAKGRPLYERLGFRIVDAVAKHVGEFIPGRLGDWPRVRGPMPSDEAQVLRHDQVVFGADRTGILRHLGAFAEQVVIAEDHRGIIGHAAAWRNLDVLTIGPVVARDNQTAMALMHTMAAGAGGTVRVDVPVHFTEASRWLQGCGLQPKAPDPLMSYLGQPLPGSRDQLYALFMQALG